MKVAFYLITTGEIDWIFAYPPEAVIPADVDADLEPGYAWKEIPLTAAGADVTIETYYVSGGNFTPRPVLFVDNKVVIEANGGINANGKVEFAMPSGTVVLQHRDSEEFTSGAENFTFQTLRRGIFAYSFTPPFPYQPLDLEIEANAI
jgi:hypothetical protein